MVRFLEVLGRHTYITPTSYLELIGALKNLIIEKQQSTMNAKKRYLVGLEKLAFAASQVTFGVITSLYKSAHWVNGRMLNSCWYNI